MQNRPDSSENDNEVYQIPLDQTSPAPSNLILIEQHQTGLAETQGLSCREELKDEEHYRHEDERAVDFIISSHASADLNPIITQQVDMFRDSQINYETCGPLSDQDSIIKEEEATENATKVIAPLD